jgi:uncharacterized phage protein (TIGR01671 family)
MRKFKFKAYDLVNKKMCYVRRIEWSISSDNLLVWLSWNEGNVYREELRDSSQVILLQYTGVKDITGKEVYEGDIIQYQQHDKTITWKDQDKGKTFDNVEETVYLMKAKVKFETGSFTLGYHLDFPDIEGAEKVNGIYDIILKGRSLEESSYGSDSLTWWDNFEVIGNVYENPELLETTIMRVK